MMQFLVICDLSLTTRLLFSKLAQALFIFQHDSAASQTDDPFALKRFEDAGDAFARGADQSGQILLGDV